MPNQTLHVSRTLSNISAQYRNTMYISQSFMGVVPVAKESDLYWVWNRDWRQVESRRANGSEVNEVTFSASTSSYTLYERAIGDFITDRDRENADEAFMLDRDVTEFLTDKLWLDLEVQARDLCFTTTTWSNNAGITATGWGLDTTTSLPMINVHSATAVIQRQAGVMPNTLVFGADTFHAMQGNDDLLDRIKYTERGILTEELLGSVFGLRVFVGRAARDTTNEYTAATTSVADIWTGDALIAYFSPGASIKSPSAGYIFRKQSAGSPFKVKKYRVESREGDKIEVSTFQQAKAVATSAAFLFKGAVGA